ncbi:MAG TPA: DUF3455 domain-containing protein [Anaeromyxobacter sp.]|nr:DUF3455 domain-containing protein [Anaeromyxobacter sp.]
MSLKVKARVVGGSIAVLVAAISTASAEERRAASPSASSAPIPAALAAPAGHELAFELLADGVQIYSCVHARGAAGAAAAWEFQAPEATLTDRRGRRAGQHGAGPTWEALDGSSVKGAKVESATPDPSAIPWLLLRAASHGSGAGQMADVTFVQRVWTSGGNAPSDGCGDATVGATARVPYRAVYRFYHTRAIRPGEGERAIPTGGSSYP